jgi:quercetin dioxygenase-like cupin family protein
LCEYRRRDAVAEPEMLRGFVMSRVIVVSVLFLGSLVTSPIRSQEPQPKPVLPGSLVWVSPPSLPDIKTSWVLGAESQAGTYVLRVMLRKGARIPAHTHPDTRYTTVLSGTLYVGFGEVGDDSKMVAVPAGAVYVAPAGVPHYLHARDGRVVYQEGGSGPTATVILKRSP